MRFAALFVAGILFTVAMSGIGTRAEAQGARQVALVVGNGAYTGAAALKNPAADARLIAESLKALGFETQLAIDVDGAGFRQALRRFAESAEGASRALFFYAGHGLQVRGENHLVPVDAQLKHERDLVDETIDLQRIMTALSGAQVRLVFLDACRDNPFVRSMRSLATTRGKVAASGLAQMQAAESGTLIVYSTSPDNVAVDGQGANSPFAAALARHVRTPGLDVRQVVGRVRAEVLRATDGKQLPWDNSSLLGDVMLAGAISPAPPRPAVGAPPAADVPGGGAGADAERLFWSSIKDSKDAAEFEAYLAQYPSGTFAALARTRLAALRRAAPSPAPVPTTPVPTTPVPTAPAPPAPAPVASTTSPERLQGSTAGAAFDADRVPYVGANFSPIARWIIGLGRPWALAVHASGVHSARPDHDGSGDQARRALEACEFIAGSACFLYAVDGRLTGNNQPQPQARLRVTSGAPADARNVPFISPQDANTLTSQYTLVAARGSPVAVALSIYGVWFVAYGSSAAAAEAEAIRLCTAGLIQMFGGNTQLVPCFLYESGGRVAMRPGGFVAQRTQ